MDISECLTVKDVADKLKVTQQYVRKLISSEFLKAQRIGNQWIISETDLKSYIIENDILIEPDDHPRKGEKLPDIVALSFFSGAMGLDIGMANGGIKALLACEFNKYCRLTITKNEPEIALIGDISKYSAYDILKFANIPEGQKVDVIFGGPPCQAFSTAGARRALDDERGNIFLKYIELIRDIKPTYVVIENVRGLLSAPYPYKNVSKPIKGGALCIILDKLEEAGYTLDDLTDITWSKFEEIGKDIHEKTGKYLLTSEATGGDTLMMMIQSCGANFVNEDGEAYIVGNETAEKCIDLYTELVQNDVVKLVNNWDEYIATITSGEAAGIVNGNWITATLMSTEDQKGLWGITTMPKIDGVDTATNYANNGGSSWYITSNCKNVELAEDFLASTFGSSTDFYDAILPETGAISCYLPAGESDVYNEPNEFFGGQPIFSTIVEYSSHIPEFTKTPYHYEARECVNTAVVNIVNGTAKEDALQEAQDTLAFKMTE